MRSILVFVYFLLVMSPLKADSEPIYQLHDPTADEYLAALPAILDQSGHDYGTLANLLVKLTWAELQTRYTPLSDHPYSLLAAVHPYYTVNYMEGISHDLFNAWLREHSYSFANFGVHFPLIFDDFVIYVTQRDFNADGQHEWVFDIHHENRFAWKEVITETRPGQYQEITTPLFIFDGSWSPSSGFDEELTFQDLNHDGLPEWVIAVGGYGGGPETSGHLLVLQWSEGKLIDLTASDPITYSAPAGGGSPTLFPYGTTVDFMDVDHNGTQEILIRQLQDDNWGCTWTQTHIYGWQGTQYALLSDTRQSDEVKGCSWQAAETAMWAHDYKTAITGYERAYTLPFAEREIWDEKSVNDLWEYEQVRLALAYALTNQDSKAQDAIRNLQSVGLHSGIAQRMSAALWPKIGQDSAPDICQAVYDVWFRYLNIPPGYWETDSMQYWSALPTRAIVGYTDEFASSANWPSLPTSEKAGCDITGYGRPLSKTYSDLFVEDLRSKPVPEHTSINYGSSTIYEYQVVKALYAKSNEHFLALARLWLGEIQHGVEGDEWEARYLLAAALRRNNRPDEALEQYSYIYKNSPLASWRQLAGLYLTSSEEK